MDSNFLFVILSFENRALKMNIEKTDRFTRKQKKKKMTKRGKLI